VRSGAVYPDWGYLSDDYSAAAEDAHWAPFRNRALDDHKLRYAQPWSAHAERVLAFYCGLGVHGRTDDRWHFGSDSFLQQAMQNDLPDTDPADAELIIEILTDFIVQQDHRPQPENNRLWVPVADILAVHQASGHTSVGRDAILFGTGVQSVGYLLEDLLWPFLGPIASAALPWTDANYLSWKQGGVEDSATRSARVMERMWDRRTTAAPNSDEQDNSNAVPLEQALAHRNQLIRQLAIDLIETGAVRPRWTEDEHGAVEFARPEVRDWDAVWRALNQVRLLAATQ